MTSAVERDALRILGEGCFTRNELILNGNGIEIKRRDFSPKEPHSRTYAEKCFNHLVSGDHDFRILGPRFMDNLFRLNQGHLHTPSIVKFKVNSMNEWQLTDIYETKASGVNKRESAKLKNLQTFTDHLRTNPQILQELLEKRVGNVINTPANVIIPPDSDIAVTFAYPFKIGFKTPPVASGFVVGYKRI